MARREVRGFEVEACVRCGAVLMDSSALDIIASGGEDTRTPVPSNSATPSAPPPRWVHKASDAPRPLYGGATASNHKPPVQSPPSDEVPLEAQDTEEAPLSAWPSAPPATPRSAGPRRRTPPPAPSAETPVSERPIYRPTQRPGSSPTLMPDVGSDPGLGDLSSAFRGTQRGPGWLVEPESTEEVAKTTVGDTVPVAQQDTAPRPPDRSPAAFDDPALTEWTRRRRRTRKLLVWTAVITWVGIFLALIVVGWLAWTRNTLAPYGFPAPGTASPPPDAAAVVPAPTPPDASPPAPEAPAPAAAEPAPPTEPAPPAEPIPVAQPTPQTQPVAAPRPQPAPQPAPASSAALISRGWSLVERDPVAAAAAFDSAMARNNRDPEANYGYGYALIRQGNSTAAAYYLCRALPAASTETSREVTALLERNGLTCN